VAPPSGGQSKALEEGTGGVEFRDSGRLCKKGGCFFKFFFFWGGVVWEVLCRNSQCGALRDGRAWAGARRWRLGHARERLRFLRRAPQGPANVDAIGTLVELGADVAVVTEQNSMETPLHIAARSGRADVLEKLLRCGVKVTAQTKVRAALGGRAASVCPTVAAVVAGRPGR
jgi:Ankyrin repeat